ncbi:MAG: hypothetical protein WCL02_00985 [bacterium]
MKNIALLFYHLELCRIDDRIEELIKKGHSVKVFCEEKKFLSLIQENPKCFDIVITEMILQGMGDDYQFFGKRNGMLDDCASLLADELDARGFSGKIVVYTSWDHVQRLFSKVKENKRFAKVITQEDGEEEFLQQMEEILNL